MAVRAVKNQYRGINAHLHSLLQDQDWVPFHTVHSVDIANTMKKFLRPMGYVADLEQSLQQYQGETWLKYRHHEAPLSNASWGNTATALFSVPEALAKAEEAEAFYYAVTIRRSINQDAPLAWIELLSPSNKPEGAHAAKYEHKRNGLIASGVVFVEIDYLHETPPTIERLPNYRYGGPDAHPYRIIVVSPPENRVPVYEFDVETPIPVVDIPLNAGQIFSFDFGLPYEKTFEESFLGDRVDYAELPVSFQRYREADQLRIVRRMLTVLEAAHAGANLELGALPLQHEDMTLADGLKRVELLRQSLSQGIH